MNREEVTKLIEQGRRHSVPNDWRAKAADAMSALLKMIDAMQVECAGHTGELMILKAETEQLQSERDAYKKDAEATEKKAWLNFYSLMEKSLIFGFDTPQWMKEECRQRLDAAMKGEE